MCSWAKKICVNLCIHVLFSARLKCVTRINDHTCHCVSMWTVLILQWSSGNPCIAGAYCRLYAQLFCFFSFILLSLSCNYCCIVLLFFIASTCTYMSCNLNVLTRCFIKPVILIILLLILYVSKTCCTAVLLYVYVCIQFFLFILFVAVLVSCYRGITFYVVLYIYSALCRTYSDILSPSIKFFSTYKLLLV